MAINALETRVLQLIGENIASPDVFTDTASGMAPIRDSLNDAIQEIVGLTGSYKEKYYLPLNSSQTFYRMTFSRGVYGWVADAWLVNQGRRLVQTDLIKLNKKDPRWMVSTGTPWEYFLIGMDVIGFYHKPSSTSDLVELSCIVIPNEYKEGTDRIKIRDEFQWAAVHFAVSEYWASRGDAGEAIKHHQIYLQLLDMQSVYPLAQEEPKALKTVKTA